MRIEDADPDMLGYFAAEVIGSMYEAAEIDKHHINAVNEYLEPLGILIYIDENSTEKVLFRLL